jgi:hypothetical protein
VTSSQSSARLLSPHIKPRVQRFVVLVVLAWLVWRAWTLIQFAWAFNTDDAYITLRYSRHLAEGRGLVWNPGEDPVEGYSNFTYVLFGAMALKAKTDPIIFLKGLGAVAGVANLFLSYALARHWAGALVALMAPILISAHVGNTWWAVSGLETPFYQALLLLATICLIRGMGYRWVDADRWEDAPEANRPHGYHASWLGGAGIVAAFAGMTRPEGPLIFILGSATLIVDGLLRYRDGELEDWRRPARALVAMAMPFCILYGGYFLIRWVYFGRMFPNTIYCKGNYRGAPAFKLHLSFWSRVAPHLLFALLVPLRRLDPRHFLIWGVPLAYGVMLYRVDPIISHFNRHFMAAHAFVCVGVAIAMAHLVHLLFDKRVQRAGSLAIIVVVLALQGRLRMRVAAPMSKLLEDYGERMANREDLGLWLDARMTRDETFVIGDAGMVPYLARARVIDAYCLNSPVMTSSKINKKPKRWVDWVLRQGPERIVVHSSDGSRLKVRSEYNFYPTLVADGRFKADYVEEKRFPDKRFAYFVFKRRDDAEDPDRPNPDAKRKMPEAADEVEESGGEGGEESTGGAVPARDASGRPIDADGNQGAGFIPVATGRAKTVPATTHVVRPTSPRPEPLLAPRKVDKITREEAPKEAASPEPK